MTRKTLFWIGVLILVGLAVVGAAQSPVSTPATTAMIITPL